MTNPLRGEVLVELAGEEYKARLNIDAIMNLEQQLGMGIVKLMMNMSEANVRITDLVAILVAALRGGGNDVKDAEVKAIVTKAGLMQTTQVVSELLAAVVSSSDDSSEDSESAKKKED